MCPSQLNFAALLLCKPNTLLTSQVTLGTVTFSPCLCACIWTEKSAACEVQLAQIPVDFTGSSAKNLAGQFAGSFLRK